MMASLIPNLVSAYVPSLARHGYTVADMSRRANNGTLTAVGASPLSADVFSASGSSDALRFTSARGDRLSTGRNPHGAGNITACSLTCWAKFTAFANAANTIFETNDQQLGFSNYQFASYITSSGKLGVFALQALATQSSYDGTGNFTLAVNTWYFLAFVFRGGVRQEGYVNGRLDGSVALPVAFVLGADKPVIWGGSDQYLISSGASRLLDAEMDEMCRWDRDLSRGEINWLYSQGRGNLFRRRRQAAYGVSVGGGGVTSRPYAWQSARLIGAGR
jgi:hypothetical protein